MGKLPETQQSLSRWLRQRERTALRQRQTSAFARSGTSVTAEGAQSLDGTLTVTPDTGFVSIDGSLGVHGTAAFDGTTTIGGDLVVAGTLSLPNAIIGNDALTSPVIPDVVNSLATNFALGFTQVDLIDVPLVVPAGCTSLQVNATGRMSVLNNYAGINAVDIYVHLDTTYGEIFYQGVPMASKVTVAAGLAVLATGLTPGSTLHLYARAGSLSSITADTSNMAVLTATLLWLR